MEVNGSNKDDDDVEVRGKDEQTLKFPTPLTAIVNPVSYIDTLFSGGRSHNKSMEVDVYKKK